MRLITDEQHTQIVEAFKRLSELQNWKPFVTEDKADPWVPAEHQALEALTTLQALPEVEAVAKICHRTNGHASLWWDEQQALDRNEGHVFTPLYATKEPS